MRYNDLDHFLSKGKDALAKGPVALLFAEDLAEVDTTVRHNLICGFREVILFAKDEIPLPDDLEKNVRRVPFDIAKGGGFASAVNRVIAAAGDIWLYYSFNAEYLFFPFSESRKVGEMLAFHTEERRDAMLTYVVDLYAGDLTDFPEAVSLETAYIDRTGYYALAREDAKNGYAPKDRQLDVYGGLRWRFEEHVPFEKRRIDRISLFKAKPGLELLPNHTFNDEEYNTYACPWHHNLTAAVCSFRAAKALRANPGSRHDIHTFQWHSSIPFEWRSQQLLDLGLMEPGQWF